MLSVLGKSWGHRYRNSITAQAVVPDESGVGPGVYLPFPPNLQSPVSVLHWPDPIWSQRTRLLLHPAVVSLLAHGTGQRMGLQGPMENITPTKLCPSFHLVPFPPHNA